MSLEHARVVLIEPHYPGNVGATARVMANFGLRDLVLVAPVADPRDRQARRMSAHGEAILESARIVTDLSEAIGDCVLVVGTSANVGGPFRRQNAGTPDLILPHLAEALVRNRPAAILFGPEPSGLSNEVVTRCHYLIHIPTAAEYPALNLAQAVAICLYELRRSFAALSAAPAEENEPATLAEQEHLFAELRTALQEIHFVYGDKADTLMHAVRHLLGKASLSQMEVKLLLGLARQIRWHVAHHPDMIG